MFDPFEKRTSRDIRNRLCDLFLQALEAGDAQGFCHRARTLGRNAPDRDHLDFIEDRINRCTAVFTALESNPPAEPAGAEEFTIAFHLWSRRLFFECHEWLEPFWRRGRGPEKKAIQALIRSAGACVLWEAGRIGPARSSAQKALDLIHEFAPLLPAPFCRENLLPILEKILKKE